MARKRKPNSDAGLEERVELARWALYAGYPMFGAILGPFRGSFWTQFLRKRESSSEAVGKESRIDTKGQKAKKRIELGRWVGKESRTRARLCGAPKNHELRRRPGTESRIGAKGVFFTGEVETTNCRRVPASLGHAPGSRGSRGSPGNDDTARSSEPGNRAHAFRMTFVAQGKLPQINSFHY